MILAMALLTAHAQNLTPTPAAASYKPEQIELIPGVRPGPAPPADQVDIRAKALGRTIRCPVCQGSNISDSPAETAKAMLERTRQLVAAGYDEQQIIDYFVDKYDEHILLDPKTDGWNAILYIAPGLGFGLALALALAAVGRRQQEDGASTAPPPTELDDYERRLLAELNGDDA